MDKKEIEQRIEEIKEEINTLENNENTEEYDDMLNDCYPEVKIGNMTFSPSDVLKNCDEVAYDMGLSEYNDEKLNELNEELEELIKDLEECENDISTE